MESVNRTAAKAPLMFLVILLPFMDIARVGSSGRPDRSFEVSQQAQSASDKVASVTNQDYLDTLRQTLLWLNETMSTNVIAIRTSGGAVYEWSAYRGLLKDGRGPKIVRIEDSCNIIIKTACHDPREIEIDLRNVDPHSIQLSLNPDFPAFWGEQVKFDAIRGQKLFRSYDKGKTNIFSTVAFYIRDTDLAVPESRVAGRVLQSLKRAVAFCANDEAVTPP